MKAKNKSKEKVPVYIIIAAVACVLAMIAVFVCLHISSNRVGEFVPPAFETNAEQGIPEAPEGMGWNEVYQQGMEFKVGICGAFVVVDGKADVYFANLSEGDAWLKLCVTDENGNILGETGILKQNEYVKSIILNEIPENETAITMKIMAYESETYYSLGAVKLNTTAFVG